MSDGVAVGLYNFTGWDYVIVVWVLGFTAIVGGYHIWMARRTNQNTQQFLLTNRNLGLVPIVLSTAATAISAGSLLGTPMQGYANGVQMMTGYVGFFLGLIVPAFTTMPVLYRLNVSTVNQYIEYRFNRFLRIFPALMGMIMQSFIASGVTYLTALVLTQATGIPIGCSITLLGGLCIVYSSLGGFTAVIWTDTFQMVIIFATYILMFFKGTIDAGGIGNIWDRNEIGNRTTFVHFSPVEHSGYTVWSLIIGEFAISFCVMCGSQSFLQRQASNRTIGGARKTIFLTAAITQVLSIVSVWIGMAAYAKYFRCDPVLTGQIQSTDQIVAQFAMDLFKGFSGLSGLYVAGILCATLSTLSSHINSFAAIVLIDFLKPLMPDSSDETSKKISKLIALFYGLVIIVMSTVSKHLGNLVAMMHAIGGCALGTGSGIYVLGFFFPSATSKGTTIGYLVSLIFGWWLSLGRLLIGNPYIMAPVSADNCNATNNYNQTIMASVIPASKQLSEESLLAFPLRNVIPIWYAAITLGVTVVVGLIASIITGPNNLDKLNPNLISPFAISVLQRLPLGVQNHLGLVSFLMTNAKFVDPTEVHELKKQDGGQEDETHKPETD